MHLALTDTLPFSTVVRHPGFTYSILYSKIQIRIVTELINSLVGISPPCVLHVCTCNSSLGIPCSYETYVHVPMSTVNGSGDYIGIDIENARCWCIFCVNRAPRVRVRVTSVDEEGMAGWSREGCNMTAVDLQHDQF